MTGAIFVTDEAELELDDVDEELEFAELELDAELEALEELEEELELELELVELELELDELELAEATWMLKAFNDVFAMPSLTLMTMFE